MENHPQETTIWINVIFDRYITTDAKASFEELQITIQKKALELAYRGDGFDAAMLLVAASQVEEISK